MRCGAGRAGMRLGGGEEALGEAGAARRFRHIHSATVRLHSTFRDLTPCTQAAVFSPALTQRHNIHKSRAQDFRLIAGS